MWRLFRTEQPRAVQALAGLVAAMLLTDLAGLGATGSVVTSASGPGAGAAGGSGTVSANGSGPGGTATSPGGSGAGASSPLSGTTSGVGGGAGAGGNGAGVGSGGGAGGGGGGGTGPAGGGLASLGHGVTSSSIKVVFPWPNLGPVEQAIGLYGSSEDPVLSIQAAVDAINASGGINGRTIDPEIVGFDPLNDSNMRADCLQWTQDQKVFAVVDANAWHDDQQLCVTQENHTPLISEWTTVTDWTRRGDPYLWWTGPDVADVLSNLVTWAKGARYLTPSTNVGVVAADREGDSLATGYLKRDLTAAGLRETDSGTMHFDLNNAAQAQVEARDIVVRFQTEGIHTLIPLLPYTDFVYLVEAAQEQNYYPRWLLSDYEYEDTAALGLIDPSVGGPYAKELNNAVNPTFFNLGDSNGPYPAGTLAASCNAAFNKYSGAAWAKQDPNPPYKGYIESQGTAMTWCENIDLFAAAARLVPANQLTQQAFTGGMMRLSSWPAAIQPTLTYGPQRRAGPHEYRVVEEHVNSDHACPLEVDGASQGDCWLIQQNWREAGS